MPNHKKLVMRKEILFAIIAGSLLGLVVAFGVWRANLVLKSNQETAQEEAQESPEQVIGLTIAKPFNNQVVTSSSVKISGVSKANSWVVISAEEKDYIVPSDETGTFEIETKLVGGINEMIITAFNDQEKSQQEKLILVHSTQFTQDGGSEEKSATPEGETVEEKVQEKLEEVQKQALAFIGTVTDIAEKTLQINKFAFNGEGQEKGEIQLISLDENTSYIKQTKKTETIKLEDVAIGDFIVAMGHVNGNSVLEAIRILVINTPEPSHRTAILGQVSKVDQKTLTAKIGDQEITLEFGKSWEGPDLDEIAENDQIIAVGTMKEKTLTTRTIKLTSTPTPYPEAED
jgi:hypothetical protein